jgi:hypothetical protein
MSSIPTDAQVKKRCQAVYDALVKARGTTVSEIARLTGVDYHVVYRMSETPTFRPRRLDDLTALEQWSTKR